MLADPITLQREREAFAAHTGPIAALLSDDSISDIMLNAPRSTGEPGEVWADINGVGLQDTGVRLDATAAELLVRTVAQQAGYRSELDADHPLLSCQAAGGQFRFEATFPPASPHAVSFTARKYIARPDIALTDYVERCELSAVVAAWLAAEARDGRAILLAGKTCSGKTTLLNALLREAAVSGDCKPRRMLVIEDTPEIVIPPGPSDRRVVNQDSVYDFQAAVASAMRQRPDGVVLGEVRHPGAAVQALDAWSTDHSGIGTIHAGSPQEALWRFYSLCRQSPLGLHLRERDVARAISASVHIRRDHGRRVIDVQRVAGWNAAAGEYELEPVR